MENRQIAEKIKEVCRLDMDIARSYDQALRRIDRQEITDDLVEFRDNHLENARGLSAYLEQFGDKLPGYREIEKAPFSQGLKEIGSDMDTSRVLRILADNEQFASDRIRVSIDGIGVPEITHELEEDLEDDLMHVTFLRSML